MNAPVKFIMLLWNLVQRLTLGRDQVNLLVYGPDRPYFRQKQKTNIAKFWQTGFLKNPLFSAFFFKKKVNKT